VRASGERAEALERARVFVAERGAPLACLRVEVLTGRAAPEETRGFLEALQQPDGSFAPLDPRRPAGPVAATLEGLWALAELRVRRAPSVERAVGFLSGAQAPDGSWSDAPGAPDAARIAPTGFVAGELARSVYTRPQVLEAAGRFLAGHCGWQEPAAWEDVAAQSVFFANVAHDLADAVLQRCGRALEHGFRTGAFSGARTARVLVLCDARGLPGARLDPGELVAAILSEQRSDGGWPADGDGSDAARVEATLQAVLALVRLPG